MAGDSMFMRRPSCRCTFDSGMILRPALPVSVPRSIAGRSARLCLRTIAIVSLVHDLRGSARRKIRSEKGCQSGVQMRRAPADWGQRVAIAPWPWRVLDAVRVPEPRFDLELGLVGADRVERYSCGSFTTPIRAA